MWPPALRFDGVRSDAGCHSPQQRVRMGRWHLWVLLPFIPSSHWCDVMWCAWEWRLHETHAARIKRSAFADKPITWRGPEFERRRWGGSRSSKVHKVLDGCDSTCSVWPRPGQTGLASGPGSDHCWGAALAWELLVWSPNIRISVSFSELRWVLVQLPLNIGPFEKFSSDVRASKLLLSRLFHPSTF